MRDHRHEFVAHGQRALQLPLRHVQFGQHGFLCLARLFQRQYLAPHRFALFPQRHEHLDLAAHGARIERLVQHIDRAGLVALERVVEFLAGGGDEDDRDLPGFLGAAHQFGQLEAVHARHLHVEKGHGKVVLEQQRQRLFTGAGLEDLAARAPDHGVQGLQVFRQIVDDQQFGRLLGLHQFFSSFNSNVWIASSGSTRSGRRTRIASCGMVATSAS